ncbi:uncharacterized protein L969DRAFT_104320 [Mixia osmundae IAM 14324]|uniref:HMG box domain-containing protein n=1 Tax=Mixia osmundae (strain CBS 9802 / IAM 14324 / JCM 22182 / KY 12970) TaxID=764103 RepID=G7E7P4_MIXOS|nr:uncharacterized protein L969DRAFT_104320 [Mixia osmundae IAM 14324]KEI38454.1 hypothetical protein L969DRAFT_104320 [Mixia osmundae IAM 14324]GAA98854.1 hypothetical protein E5Q_05542 [Mixia osmundae IAM 14324]
MPAIGLGFDCSDPHAVFGDIATGNTFVDRDGQVGMLSSPLLSPKKANKRNKNKSHIPRAPNKFILYRHERLAANDLGDSVKGKVLRQSELSKIIGELWRKEPAEVKERYAQKAAQAKREHGQMYPNYCYRPAKRIEMSEPASPKACAKVTRLKATSSRSRTASAKSEMSFTPRSDSFVSSSDCGESSDFYASDLSSASTFSQFNSPIEVDEPCFSLRQPTFGLPEQSGDIPIGCWSESPSAFSVTSASSGFSVDDGLQLSPDMLSSLQSSYMDHRVESVLASPMSMTSEVKPQQPSSLWGWQLPAAPDTPTPATCQLQPELQPAMGAPLKSYLYESMPAPAMPVSYDMNALTDAMTYQGWSDRVPVSTFYPTLSNDPWQIADDFVPQGWS